MENILNISRVNLLVKRHLVLNFKTYLLSVSAIAAFMLLLTFASISTDFLGSILKTVFFIGGLLLTSRMFSELNNPYRGFLYLTLPANPLEKLMSVWFISTILYIATSIVFFYLVNYIFILGSTLTEGDFGLINLFNYDMLKFVSKYLLFHSIFMAGAIHFKRNHFFKTILAIIGILVFLMASANLILSLFIPNFSISINDAFFKSDYYYWIAIVFSTMIFMLVTYFKIKEREV